MPRKHDKLTISVSPIARQGLERIARQHGCMWGDNANISALMEAIGVGQLTVVGDANVQARVAALKKDPKVKEFMELLKQVGE